MLYKDACNGKSNQQHLGTITCSNLCTEIIEFTSPDEAAVCNLASLTLPRFVTLRSGANATADVLRAPTADRVFDFESLRRVTRVVARNLNKVIDVNQYPIPEAATSNLRHRPMGLGVNGLADAFILLGEPFDSPRAKQLNKDIFETIYFAAMEASAELAEAEGPYPSFPGSPLAAGKFQFDLWGLDASGLSGRWDWEALRRRVTTTGARNSLLLAPMPTASTAQILGSNECIEPYTSNLYARRVRAGEFIVANPHLVRDLIARDLWTPGLRNELVAAGGSVQALAAVPDDLKALYRTVWEIKQRALIDMAADR
jgi:ribonucleotide reductase alpha subunit